MEPFGFSAFANVELSFKDFCKLLNGDRCYELKKKFAEKIGGRIGGRMAFMTKNKAKLCKILIKTLFFEKNANFFAENGQKLQKIVVITQRGRPPWFVVSFVP
jgi:hypothetical protein